MLLHLPTVLTREKGEDPNRFKSLFFFTVLGDAKNPYNTIQYNMCLRKYASQWRSSGE